MGFTVINFFVCSYILEVKLLKLQGFKELCLDCSEIQIQKMFEFYNIWLFH
jgi:hypothetical protein